MLVQVGDAETLVDLAASALNWSGRGYGASAVLSPAGTACSDVVERAGADGLLSRSITVTAGQTQTRSLYVKQGTRRYWHVSIHEPDLSSDAWAVLDAQTGTITSQKPGMATPATATLRPDGYARVALTQTYTSTGDSEIRVRPCQDSAGAVISPVPGAISGQVWGFQPEPGFQATPLIRTLASPVAVKDYTLATAFAPDGSLAGVLTADGTLAWTNAPATTWLEQQGRDFWLCQPSAQDTNLIGVDALSLYGDLSLGRSAWQDVIEPVVDGQEYFFRAIVKVEGAPTYGPQGLFKVLLSGTNPSIGTATWTPIPDMADHYRLRVAGLSVTDSTGRIGVYRAPNQPDVREFKICEWNFSDSEGRLLAGGASELDLTRDGFSVTLTRALTDGIVEAVWA